MRKSNFTVEQDCAINMAPIVASIRFTSRILPTLCKSLQRNHIANLNTMSVTDNAVKPAAWAMSVEHLDPKQVAFYHSEKLIRVDEQDNVLGPISKGESHAMDSIRRSIYHRALSLLVFDKQDRFLLTQRAACKITFPNYYTNACCSHPQYNELELEDDGDAIGVKRATIRRSSFELGTQIGDIQAHELKLVNKLAYRAESDGGQWGEAEIDYIFILHKDIAIKPNPDEVQSYRYVTREEMRDVLDNSHKHDIKVTPWVRLLSRDFLFKYWDNLHSLDAIAEPNTIINYKELFAAR